MKAQFETLLDHYRLRKDGCSIAPIGEGHIHKTYKVELCDGGYPPIILQEINTRVFPNVEHLMENLEKVTEHLAHKNRKLGKDPKNNGVVFLENQNGESWTKLEDDSCWRLCWYLQEKRSYEMAPNPKVAMAGGKAIAQFIGQLSDLESNLIKDLLPRFHDLEWRMEQFEESLSHSDPKRKKKAEASLDLVTDHKDQQVSLLTDSRAMSLPLRLTHNDTKFNNILFDRDHEQGILIDLDTAMKGYSWFDFGDALRTCASTAVEDEADISKIDFRSDIYKGFAEGFLTASRDWITDQEVSVLHRAPAYFTFMQGVRFLADYLVGDRYYKVEYSEHNLVRANAQFALMTRIMAHSSLRW